MAQRGKRKARSSNTAAPSRTPRKKINLNGVSSPTSDSTAATPLKTRSQVEKALAERYQPDEITIDPTQGSLLPLPGAHSQSQGSSSGSSSSILTLATAKSQLSTSLRSLTPTFASWSQRLQSTNNNWSDWVKKRLPQRIPRALPDRMTNVKIADINVKSKDNGKEKGKGKGKGKEKAKEEDEDGNLSADESARMIELLSIDPWQKSNGVVPKEPDDDFSDDRSGVSVEHLLLGDDKGGEEMSRLAAEIPANDAEMLEERVKTETEDESQERLKEIAARGEASAEPLSITSGRDEEDHEMLNGIPQPESAELATEEAMTVSNETAEEQAQEDGSKGKGKAPSERLDEIEQNEDDNVEADNADDPEDAVISGRGENVDAEEDNPQPTDLDASNVQQDAAVHVGDMKGDASRDDQQKGGIEEAAEGKQAAREGSPLDNSFQAAETDVLESQEDDAGQIAEPEAEEDEEETILIPEEGWKGVIDLTESVSPEPARLEEEQSQRAANDIQLPRKKASTFFADGILAREIQGASTSTSSAIGAVHQLGQRSISTSGSYVKAVYKPTSDFRKREPIFSRSRKSLAREITNSKKNSMLTSLRRHAKLVLQAPHLDEMLRKKVALNRMVGDDTPDEEVQIRHLREIIARSTASLRPARRHLKEQERLALEAKLLQKRALGIMGRQPFPKVLPSDQDELVRQTFRKEGKIAQMVGAAVESRDIVKLKPGVWLNDEVINFYMKLILKRSDEAIVKRANARAAKKRLAMKEYGSAEEAKQDTALVREYSKIWNGIWNCWTFTSFFFTKLSTGGYAGVRQWTRKVDIFTKDIVLLPINISSTHWVCAAINMRRCRFEYYDSMRSKPRGVFTKLREYLLAEYDDKKKQSAGPLLLDGWTYYVSQQSPLQENAFDCGVFACQTLEQISRRNPREFELKDDLNVDKVVQNSRELAAEGKKGGSDEEDSLTAADDSNNEDEDEEWNFNQANIPYLRQRMVYEIVKTSLLND